MDTPERPTKRGSVVINPKRVPFNQAPDPGEIHAGMLGVTVIREDGSSRLYPWRVVAWVNFDKDPQ